MAVDAFVGSRSRGGWRHAHPVFSARPTAALCLAAVLAMAVMVPDRAQAAEPLDALIAQCAACHGADGRAPATPDTPLLAGQPELYALYQLVFFRQGQRKQAVMNEIMRDLDDDTVRALAKWVGELPGEPRPAGAADPERYRRGAEIADRHRCALCHDAGFAGREHIPRLAGQQEAYLAKALRDYQTGARVGLQAAMAETLAGLDAAALDDLAHYLAHFRP